MSESLEARFLRAVHSNASNSAILDRLPQLNLPQCWLVAGCLFQTVWNAQAGRQPADGISDYDVFYFDDLDLSYAAEDAVIQRVTSAMGDLGLSFDIKNQARVHLWYGERFGLGYPQLKTAKDGIDKFLVAGTCVGIGASPDNANDIYAPFGLSDIFDGTLRPNIKNLRSDRYREKAASYQKRWPHLVIVPQL